MENARKAAENQGGAGEKRQRASLRKEEIKLGEGPA